MAKRILFAMPYSPWSERVRFVLWHHGCEFEEREHVPVLGELPLRIRSGRWFGRLTVPLLIDDGVAVMDSLAIAEHVDAQGGAATLFPAEHRDAIRQLNARLEPMFQAGRARAVQSSLHDEEAARDLVPPHLRKLPLAVASGRLGSRFVAWKHPTPRGGIAERMRAGLLEVRAVLAARDYAYGAFSYADILAASAVQLVAPVDERYLPIGPVKRRTWADPQLAAEFAELVAWRDALYAKHRVA